MQLKSDSIVVMMVIRIAYRADKGKVHKKVISWGYISWTQDKGLKAVSRSLVLCPGESNLIESLFNQVVSFLGIVPKTSVEVYS